MQEAGASDSENEPGPQPRRRRAWRTCCPASLPLPRCSSPALTSSHPPEPGSRADCPCSAKYTRQRPAGQASSGQGEGETRALRRGKGCRQPGHQEMSPVLNTACQGLLPNEPSASVFQWRLEPVCQSSLYNLQHVAPHPLRHTGATPSTLSAARFTPSPASPPPSRTSPHCPHIVFSAPGRLSHLSLVPCAGPLERRP